MVCKKSPLFGSLDRVNKHGLFVPQITLGTQNKMGLWAHERDILEKNLELMTSQL